MLGAPFPAAPRLPIRGRAPRPFPESAERRETKQHHPLLISRKTLSAKINRCRSAALSPIETRVGSETEAEQPKGGRMWNGPVSSEHEPRDLPQRRLCMTPPCAVSFVGGEVRTAGSQIHLPLHECEDVCSPHIDTHVRSSLSQIPNDF